MRRWADLAPALVLIGIGLLMASPVEDADVWWLLAGGRLMVETGTFPTTDPFSATSAGAAWVNHAWGFELLLYLVFRAAGPAGLVALQALAAVGVFAVLYRLLRREGVGRDVALVLVALGALQTRGFWAPRPQLVSYLLVVLFWGLLRAQREGRGDRLWWCVPLTALWANFHGGFLVGPALIGLCFGADLAAWLLHAEPRAAVGPRLRRLAVVGVGATVAALANPFGVGAIRFALEALGSGLGQRVISEWASLPFNHPQVFLLEGLVFLSLLLLRWTPRPAAWRDVLVVVTFLHLALHAIRNGPLLVLLLIPVLGRLVEDATGAPGSAPAAVAAWIRRWAPAVGAVLLAVAAGTLAASPRLRAELAPGVGVAPGVFPERAVEFLAARPGGGGLFNDYYWGGYLIWRLYPRYRVSVDGRAAVHGAGGLAAHLEVADGGPAWREILDRSGLSLALVRSDSVVALLLRAQPDWEVLHEDAVATVFVRRVRA